MSEGHLEKHWRQKYEALLDRLAEVEKERDEAVGQRRDETAKRVFAEKALSEVEKDATEQKRLRYESNAELEKLDEAHEELKLKVAEVEKCERYMKDALQDIATWRKGCWDHDEDVGHERRDFPDEENWEMVEGVAARALTMCYPPKATPKAPLAPKSKSQQRRLDIQKGNAPKE